MGTAFKNTGYYRDHSERQFKINWCTYKMMISKITPFVVRFFVFEIKDREKYNKSIENHKTFVTCPTD